MKSLWTFTVVFVLIAVSWIPAQSQSIPDQYIVVLHDNVDPDQAVRGMGVAPMHVFRHALKGFALKIPAQAAAALARNPMVKYIEQDQVMSIVDSDKDITVIHGKPSKPTPSPTPIPPQTVPWGIAKIGVSATCTLQINIGVAVIDTGVDLDHPDLNVTSNLSDHFTAYRSADDDNGHGTHVAGTIAAKNNTLGVLGVAPGALIYPVKVLNRFGSGNTSDVIAGVDWVTARASSIRVANMSLVGGPNTALQTAINNSINAGVIYAVAAGNYSKDVINYSPANVENALTVSAVDSADNLASFSNYGEIVDMAAPGVDVYSTYKGGVYATYSGTSMASPHVCGAIALYLALAFDRTPDSNNDGVINHFDVMAAVKTAGVVPTVPRPSDPDNTDEPLLQVQTFYPTP